MRNIVWRTPLPAGGQSGIAIGAGRLFLTTLKPFEPQANGADVSKTSTDVVGWCLDAASGKILWSIALPGSVASPNLYAYSDSSSPTPLTDGTHVWFFNASGGLGCWTVDGKEVWRRSWKPWSEADGYPFNKQFEPILFGDWVFNVEPRDEGDPQRVHGWNWLRAIDKQTGKTAWIAEDATTTYNTPVLGKTADGTPAILHARGGWHGVPETPVGLSLSSLAGPQPGRTLWRWIAGTDANGEALAQPGTLGAPTWQALYVQHWDARHAYWFVHNPIESHLVFDVRTGTLERVQSLVHGVDWRRFDPVANAYIAQLDVNLRELADPAPRMHWDAAKAVGRDRYRSSSDGCWVAVMSTPMWCLLCGLSSSGFSAIQ